VKQAKLCGFARAVYAFYYDQSSGEVVFSILPYHRNGGLQGRENFEGANADARAYFHSLSSISSVGAGAKEQVTRETISNFQFVAL
jgi:hypothetical protein